MGKRIISGVLMGGILFLILWLSSFSRYIFDGVVLLVGACAVYEIYTALQHKSENAEKKSFRISLAALFVGWATCYPLCLFFDYVGLFYSFALAFIVGFISFIFDEKKRIEDFAATVFAIVYPMTLLSVLFILNKNYGMIPVLLAIGIGTISDLFAYLIGALFGKKKIFPKISPKKTYAGCIAGVFGGAIGGLLVYAIFELGGFPTYISFTFGQLFENNVGATIGIYMAFGFVIAVLSEIGDLAASRVKREVGIKDYGKILGSHGGILDRIDSILFTTFCVGILMEILKALCGL